MSSVLKSTSKWEARLSITYNEIQLSIIYRASIHYEIFEKNTKKSNVGNKIIIAEYGNYFCKCPSTWQVWWGKTTSFTSLSKYQTWLKITLYYSLLLYYSHISFFVYSAKCRLFTICVCMWQIYSLDIGLLTLVYNKKCCDLVKLNPKPLTTL